jgi:hypothetical protein
MMLLPKNPGICLPISIVYGPVAAEQEFKPELCRQYSQR